MSNINVSGSGHKVTGDRTQITIKIGSVIVVAAVFIASIFLFSSKNIEDKIIGTWQNEKNTELYITFLENNSVSLTDNIMTLDGTYIFTGDNSIKITLKALFLEYVITADVSIKNNTLSFENVNDSYESGTWLGGESTTSFKKIK